MARAEHLITESQSPDANREERRAGGAARMMRQRISQAIRSHRRGEFERAIRTYRWYLAREPDNPNAMSPLCQVEISRECRPRIQYSKEEPRTERGSSCSPGELWAFWSLCSWATF